MLPKRETRGIRNKLQRKKATPKSDAETETEDVQPNRDWSQERLGLGYCPRVLPCRLEEKKYLTKFIKDALAERLNCKVLYIGGVPGIGKTATILQTISGLKQYCKGVHFKYLNAAKMRTPCKFYEQFYAVLRKHEKELPPMKQGSKSVIISQVSGALSKTKKHYLVVVDEVDLLFTTDQHVYYNMFEWSYLYPITFIVVANTVDFPDRLLPKVRSRMGDRCLFFRPYTSRQIMEVIKERLIGCPFFDNTAISYACNKLCSVSSDIRRILNVLKTSLDQCKGRNVQAKDIAANWEALNQQSNFFCQLNDVQKKIVDSFTTAKNTFNELCGIFVGFNRQQLLFILQNMAEQGIIKIIEKNNKGLLDYQITLLRDL